MEYTLVIVYANGETTTIPCFTMTDVFNWMRTTVRSTFSDDLNRDHVTFQVIDNTKMRSN